MFSFVAVWCLLTLVVCTWMKQIDAAEFIFGGEAKRVCEAYKRICPAKKICALQSLDWPVPMKFPVCVHERHLVVKSKICRKAPAHGKCAAKFMRWYFNVHMGTCSWFTYSGCGGNENNFRTAEECEARCMGPDSSQPTEDIVNMTNEDGDLEEANSEDTIVREPKFHPAPEELDLDSASIRASLQLGNSKHATTKSPKKHSGNKAQQKKNKKKKQKKMKQKKVKKIKQGAQQTRPYSSSDISLTETTSQGYLEMRAPRVSVQRHRTQNHPPAWQMDTRFDRSRANSQSGVRSKNSLPRSRGQAPKHSSGAQQDSYYDKVKMFELVNKKT